MNSSRRAGWLVPFINRQTWTAVWAAALREPSVRVDGEGGRGWCKKDKRREVGRGGLAAGADGGAKRTRRAY